jgi:hypothetical protein
VDNGDFLLQISQRCSHAHRLLKEAKILELSGQDEDILYAAFENAYEAYNGVYVQIESSLGKMERLKLKAKRRDMRTAVINGVSIAVGIVGVLATAVTYFLTR